MIFWFFSMISNDQQHDFTVQHYMAFAKNTNLKMTSTSLFENFCLFVKSQVLKNQKCAISCPRPLFCLSCELPGIKPASTAELPTTLTNKPNTQVKRMLPVWQCMFIWNHSFLQNFELAFPNGRNSISRYFFSQNPKCWFILFQYTNVYLCANFGDLKPTIDEEQRP